MRADAFAELKKEQKHPTFLSKNASHVLNGKWMLAHPFHWHYFALTLTDSITSTEFGPSVHQSSIGEKTTLP